MRTIEFRGLRVDGKGWAYGYYFTNGKDHGIIDNAFFLGSWTPIRPETVGQFTGLYDRNGVKVFDGDTLQSSNNSFTVNFRLGSFVMNFLNGDNRPNNGFILAYDFNIERFEATGNIHEL